MKEFTSAETGSSETLESGGTSGWGELDDRSTSLKGKGLSIGKSRLVGRGLGIGSGETKKPAELKGRGLEIANKVNSDDSAIDLRVGLVGERSMVDRELRDDEGGVKSW